MPNSAVWGNALGTQNEQQDLITPQNPAQGDHAVIKVNDVNNNNDAKIAGHFVNSSTNASARALKAEGMLEVVGPVLVNGDDLTVDGNAAVTDERNAGS